MNVDSCDIRNLKRQRNICYIGIFTGLPITFLSGVVIVCLMPNDISLANCLACWSTTLGVCMVVLSVLRVMGLSNKTDD